MVLSCFINTILFYSLLPVGHIYLAFNVLVYVVLNCSPGL